MEETQIDMATTLKLLEMQSSQMGNAERIHALIGEDCKYVPEIKRWLQWNGRFWEEIEDSQMKLNVVNAARQLTRAIHSLPNVPDRMEMLHRQQVCDDLLKLERETENKAVISFLEGLAAAKYKTFDADPFLLNVQNGTIDLKTGELLPHNKKDYCTKICTASYRASSNKETPGDGAPLSFAATLPVSTQDNPETCYAPQSPLTDESSSTASQEGTPSTTLWQQAVSTILPDPDVRHWMQKFIGYCLTGSTEEEKFVVAFGPGGSGKGTFFETIGAAIDDYKDVLPVDTLLTTNIYNGGSGPSPELAKLQGKRYVLSSESNRCRHLDEAKIKLLTGGDTITARRLQTNPFSFRPTFKLILQTNYLPFISDAMDKGIRRRLVVVPFDAQIEHRDKKLKQKLMEKENLNACLAWCVEGAKLWQEEGLDDLPDTIANAANNFYQECDLLQQWLDERTEPSLGFLKLRTALTDFNEWLRQAGNHTWQQKCFTEAMRQHGKEKTRWGHGYGYPGLALRIA